MVGYVGLEPLVSQGSVSPKLLRGSFQTKRTEETELFSGSCRTNRPSYWECLTWLKWKGLSLKGAEARRDEICEAFRWVTCAANGSGQGEACVRNIVACCDRRSLARRIDDAPEVDVSRGVNMVA